MNAAADVRTRRTAPVGLLAGWGRFPIAFAEKARAIGLPVVCVGISGEAAPELAGMATAFYWSSPTRWDG